MPEDVAFVVEVACAACEGSIGGLVRVLKGPGGEVTIETLFAVEDLGLPPRPVSVGDETRDDEPYILGAPAISRDGGEIVIGVCTRGNCGPNIEFTSDAQIAVFHSMDGGVTWSKLVDLDGAYEIIEVAPAGVILNGPLNKAEAAPIYTLYPGGEVVEPPPGANDGPIAFRNRELIWRQEGDVNKLLHSDGSGFITLTLPNNAVLLDVAESPFDDQLAVRWAASRRTVIGLVDSEGQLTQAITLGDPMATIGGWLTASQLIVTTDFPRDRLDPPVGANYLGTLPGVLNMLGGRFRPILIPFAEPTFQEGRSRVLATVEGPFARVVDTGSCLNVRAQPSVDEEVLVCVADGVLLRDTGETALIGDITWLRVVTPLGLEGWTSTAFLER